MSLPKSLRAMGRKDLFSHLALRTYLHGYKTNAIFLSSHAILIART